MDYPFLLPGGGWLFRISVFACVCLFFCYLPISPCLPRQVREARRISVKDGRDWDARARWMRSSSHVGHKSSRVLLRPKGTVVLQCSLF